MALEQSYTSIGQIFKNELLVIKLGAGFPYESLPPRIDGSIRFTVIVITRGLILLVSTRASKSLKVYAPQIVQNIIVYGAFFFLVTNAFCMVSFFSGLKNHKLFYKVLRKRIDPEYFRHSNSHRNPISTRDSQADSDPFDAEHQDSRIGRVKIARYLLLLAFVINCLCYSSRIIASERVVAELELRQKAASLEFAFKSSANDTRRSARWESLAHVSSIEAEAGSYVYRVTVRLGYVFLAALIFWLDSLQVQGQLFVVLMMTAVMSDLVSAAKSLDGLVSDRDLTGEAARRVSTVTIDERHQNQRLLTGDLLIQVRDVLLMLRQLINTLYLGLLVSDMAEMMSLFSAFRGAIAVGRGDASLNMVLEYLRFFLNVSITRIGYHWIHYEMERIKLAICEKQLVSDNGSQQLEENFAQEITREHIEWIRVSRLADDIGSIWPTDWFVPDFRSFIKHTVFVITLVATLDQLVEAGSRIDSQTSNARRVG